MQDEQKQLLTQFDYDLVVIGGGSGGLAASKEATKVKPGAKVAVLDFVQPSVAGTTWGLGGTCVNVGCVPKKLFHYASLLGHGLHDAVEYGWKVDAESKFNWPTASKLITNYVRSLNFSYKSGLRSATVSYLEGYGAFLDAHTIKWEGKAGKGGVITAEKVIIATGGRPNYGATPGHEVCITSDDIFWKKDNPGKTLVVGAGYIALECAGFLNHIGNDVSVMVRGELLRKMDRQCAQQVGELMERDGVRFLMPAVPVAFRKLPQNHPKPPENATKRADGTFEWPSTDGKTLNILHASGAIEHRSGAAEGKSHKSTWTIPAGPVLVDYRNELNQLVTEQFDTVLLAIGRTACVDDLALDKAGVQIINGKVLVDDEERTTASNIYAIGDVAIGVKHHSIGDKRKLEQEAVDRPELTPVAIQAGQLLAGRLFGASTERMDYNLVPTTVFTPVEYAFVGLSQEDAERDEKDGGLGKGNVEVWWSRFGSLEISPTHPEPKPTRSHALTGKRLWARQYAEAHGLTWSEVVWEEGQSVVVEQADGKRVEGMVARRYTAGTDIVYDIDAAGEVLSAVPNQQLRHTEWEEPMNAELFDKARCLAKLICDKRQNNKVVGLHFVGPNAGEVVQGFSLALQLGATKAHFDKLVGIHPTCAEEFTVLSATKSSGQTPLKKAGCGGGSCG